MDFWNLMIKKDDYIISMAESLRSIKTYLSPSLIKLRREMRKLPKEGIGKDLYIVLNGPSLRKQDLSVLKGKTTMFVNRGFMHPLYKELKPTYHIFVDTKMIKNIWPVTWLDEILQLSPQTKILLPLSWSSDARFVPYRNNIYWLNSKLPFYNLGVSGECFSYAIQQHFDRIYFTGFDANGIGYEMVQAADSHFYGNDSELENKSTSQFSVDLFMFSRHLHDLNRFADYCRRKNITIINMTKGGLLDMFPRQMVLPTEG